MKKYCIIKTLDDCKVYYSTRIFLETYNDAEEVAKLLASKTKGISYAIVTL